MASVTGTVRRLVLAPGFAEVTAAGRGFAGGAPDTVAHLDAIPQAVVLGFEYGMDTRTQDEIVARLELVQDRLQGFAYEGATMALTIRDIMGTGRRRLAQRFLLGPAAPHVFLAFIGIGFAMARLPRRLWSRVVPDLTGAPYYPAMTWLAVDGYGFDRAYFDSKRWVDEQYLPSPYPWQGEPDYFLSVLDHGIGRALWFMHAASGAAVDAAVRRFPEHRRAGLWSGVGLAATFAGGADAPELGVVRAAAGPYLPHLAQGAVFAAKARAMTGLGMPHTDLAVRVLCDMSVDEAAILADEAAKDAAAAGGVEYEAWRVRTRQHFEA